MSMDQFGPDLVGKRKQMLPHSLWIIWEGYGLSSTNTQLKAIPKAYWWSFIHTFDISKMSVIAG